MIIRFRAEPEQSSNLRVRVYSLDRSQLLATVTSGITESIEGSGSYECEVGSLAGYWFVLVDFLDTGEITSDGFASQYNPEVLDNLPATTGAGLFSITVTVQASGPTPIPGAAVTVTSSDGSSTIAWAMADSLGRVYFNLDAGSYKVLIMPPVPIYGTPSPQTLTVSTHVSVAYTLTTQDITPPVAPGLSTVRFLVLDAGQPVVGVKVSAELEDANCMVDTALVTRTKHTGTTDENGVADLVMIQKASFTRGGTYKITVADSSGRRSHDRRVTVPSLASCYAEDLPDA